MGRTAYLGLGLPDWNNDPVRRVVVLVALVFAVLAAVAPVARGAQGASLHTRLARALAVPNVSGSSSAAIAIDLSTGEIVFQRNPNLALVPASNEKLAITYTALAAFGPSFRIPTDLLGQGELREGVWHGDLVLKGYGDPTLSTDDLRQLAREIRAAGIRKVTGRVVGDESYFDSRRIGPGWKAWYYINESPPLSALAVDRGRYRGVFAPDPALAAAAILRAELKRMHVRVAGTAATGRAQVDAAWPLATTLSPPLHAILRFMNRESDNFTSELLLKQLGTLEGFRGTTARGGRVVRRTLGQDGIPIVGVRIADGSGLSRSNRLTAKALITLLQIAWDDLELRGPFVDSLAVAGRNGTLRDRMRRWPAAGRVLAKTGTTSVASALSGFVGRFAFVVLHNGSPVSHFWARRAQDRFAAVLASPYL
jgi:D-alanyl-D-alanine carboxypeptidase/D-alanyl-D-alanine-endopeptidase (penicillin-binding protein 4)